MNREKEWEFMEEHREEENVIHGAMDNNYK